MGLGDGMTIQSAVTSRHSWAYLTCVVVIFVCQCSVKTIHGRNVYSSARDDSADNDDRIRVKAPATLNPRSMQRHVIRYVTRETDTCNGDVFLLVAVTSSLHNDRQRAAVRKTWGSVSGKRNVKVVFFVGSSSDVTERRRLDEESATHRDIVQTDIVDSYANLTYKSLAILKWADTFCKRARYVMKTDDDMFINIPLLLDDLQSSELTRFVMGDIIAGAQPMREPDSKWYTPISAYAGKMYPSYISGTAYVISGDLVHDLYVAANATELFWLEDVFITGMAVMRTNANHVSNGKFGYRRRPMRACLFKIVITAHEVTPEELIRVWQEMNDPSIQCDYTNININDTY